MKTNVPAQAAGYFLQETRFLVHLLKASKGDIVSLEVYGDVATEKTSGEIITEENKSSIKHNPITDRSENLWKTLSNWGNAIKNNELNIEKTSFVIYVPKKCSGKFINLITEAKTDSKTEQVIATLKEEMWGVSPKYELRDKLAKSIKSYVNNFFEFEYQLLIRLIKKIEIDTGNNASYDEIEEKLKYIPNDIRSFLINHLSGWIKERIDKLIANNKLAYITYNDFYKELILYQKAINHKQILVGFAHIPSVEEKENALKANSIYIQQLNKIKVNFDAKLSAISDFMMAEIDRYYWITEEFIHEESMNEFEDALKRAWDNNKNSIDTIYKTKSKTDKGKLLYFECLKVKASLENKEFKKDYFIPGTYHALSDFPKLGWHPDWIKIFKNKRHKNVNISK